MGGWQNPLNLKFRIFSGGSLMVRIRVLNGETLLSLSEVRHYAAFFSRPTQIRPKIYPISTIQKMTKNKT